MAVDPATAPVPAARAAGIRRGAAIAVAWTCVGLLMALQAWLSYALRGDPIAWSRALGIWLAWAWAWAVLTPAILAVATRFPLAAPPRWRALAVHAIAGSASVAANLALFACAAPWVGATMAAPTWSATFLALMGTTFLLDLPVYVALVIGSESIRLARAARERERQALRLETQLAQARLHALRAQLEPHFLFNALNTIAVLMRENVDAAERVLVRLGGLLRRALDTAGLHDISLGEELEFVDAYLGVEQARFEDRLSYRIDAPAGLLDARVPSLILQPLVENAVRHGVAARASPGCIEVRASAHGDALHLCVRDDGPGLSPAARDGIGLSNTRSRLDLLYRDRHALELRTPAGGGLEVALTLPLLRGSSP